MTDQDARPVKVKVKQATKAPTSKVTAGISAGAVVTILVFVAELFHYDLDPAVAAALVTVLGGAAAWVKHEVHRD